MISLRRLLLPGKRPASEGYDAFISYSHDRDQRLAPALRNGLHRFARPWFRLRASRVFADTLSLSVNPNLWSSIEAALAKSRCFVLLASPEAAQSPWVRREVEFWQREHPDDPFLIVLTAGELTWDHDGGAFDWERTTALPDCLRGWFTAEPLWLDMRWARQEEDLSLRHPQFRDAIASLAAAVHRRPKDELIGEDVRQRRRSVRLAAASGTGLALLTALAVVLATAAVGQRNTALDQRRVATARGLVARAEALRGIDPRTTLMLGIAAQRLDPSPSTQAGLLATLTETHYAGTAEGHAGYLNAISFSPDGRTLAAASQGHTLMLWDVARHRGPHRLATLSDFTGPVSGVTFSPDGRTIATGSTEGTGDVAPGIVTLWDITDRAHPRRLSTIHTGTGSPDVTFDHDGRALVIGVTLWDVADRARPHRLSTLPKPGAGAEIASAGRKPILVSADKESAILWDISVRRHVRRLSRFSDGDDPIVRVAISPDGRTVVTSYNSYDKAMTVWDVADPARPRKTADVTGHIRLATALAFGPDSHTLVTGGDDRTALVWDLADRAHPRQRARLTGHDGFLNAIAVGPDGQTVATGGFDQNVNLWDLADPRQPQRVATLPGAGRVSALEFGSDGQTLVGISADTRPLPDGRDPRGKATIWDITDRQRSRPQATFAADRSTVQTIAVSPDGGTVATVDISDDPTKLDSVVSLWDITDRRKPRRTATFNAADSAPASPDLSRSVGDLAFSPDGHTLAIATSADNITDSAPLKTTVLLWDVTNRRQPRTLTATEIDADMGISVVKFSPDGHTLAIASNRSSASTEKFVHTVSLWRVGGHGQLEQQATLAHNDNVLAAAFTPDGHTLATSSEDNAITLWNIADLARPQRLTRLTDDDGLGPTVAFSPDGHTLAAGGGADELIIWDVTDPTNPRQAAALPDHDVVRAVAFSPDGHTLTTGADGSGLHHGVGLHLWDTGEFDRTASHAVQYACAVAGHGLNPHEWRRYAPGMPYQQTCPS